MTPDLSAFGDVRLVRALPGGHRNAIWLVDTPHGPAVAKSTRHGPDALAWLAALQAAARVAGFVVPAFHRTTTGALLSHGCTVEDWLPGTAFVSADMPGLATRLHAFHRNAPALPQRPGLNALPDLSMSDLSMSDLSLSDLPQNIATLCRHALMPFAGQPTRPIHGDISPSNLIHTAQGPALIDWDEARCDLAFLDFIAVSPRNPAEIRAHLAGEVILGWATEPAYAQTCARRLAHL